MDAKGPTQVVTCKLCDQRFDLLRAEPEDRAEFRVTGTCPDCFEDMRREPWLDLEPWEL